MNRAAQELGRMAKGVPKTITEADRLRRSNWMKQINTERPERNFKKQEKKPNKYQVI